MINDPVLIRLALLGGLGRTGPFDSDAPILVQVLEVVDCMQRFILVGTGQVLGRTMKLVGHAQEKNEQKMMFAEEDVEHLERWEVELGVI